MRTSPGKACDDPHLVKTVLPELAARRVSRMVFSAIDAMDRVRTRLTLRSRRDGWNSLGTALATICEGAMVFLLVRF